jgi:hypothetical protein
MNNLTGHKSVNRIWITLFFLAIWMPLIGSFFRWNTSSIESIAVSETRAAAKFPNFQWDLKYFDEFPAKFESYYNDFFGFRESLISWNNQVMVTAFGTAPSWLVILGKYPWLFYGGDEGYYLSPLFKLEELEQLKAVLEQRRDWLASQGIQYIFLVAPNKQSIYSEYLPDSIRYSSTKSRLDQLMDYLKQNSNVEVIDLREDFHKAKLSHQLYEKTDTHWNELGAFYAYRAVMERVSRKFPSAKPLSLSDFKLTATNQLGGDLARMLKLQPIYREDVLKLEPKVLRRASKLAWLEGYPTAPQQVTLIGSNSPSFMRFQPRVAEIQDARLPSAVVFGDSFADKGLIHFLTEHFRRTVFAGQHVFDVELIQKERPDVVIQEIVERTLVGPLPVGFLNSNEIKIDRSKK